MSVDIVTKKYIRKPLIVDAVQVTKENFEAVAAWCQGEIVGNAAPNGKKGKQHIALRVHLPLNDRQTQAYIGDWILRTNRGYKIYTSKSFGASFIATDADA